MMAIKLRTVYYATKEKYHMNLLAGSEGLDQLFSWIHILENIDTMEYLHGNEVVITTGIGMDSPSWFSEYVDKVTHSGATALIVNTGKFITEIPQDIIDKCSKLNFPLISVPWKVHLIDIIRDYCNRIFLTEQLSYSLMGSIKNAIFRPNNPELYEIQLERNNFSLDATYAIVAINGKNFNIQKMDTKFYGQLHLNIQIILNNYGLDNCIFDYDEALFIVINRAYAAQLDKFAHTIDTMLKKRFGKFDFETSVSETVNSVKDLHKAYKQVKYIMDHIQKKNSSSICFFKRNGINELVLSVNNLEILKENSQQTLEPLLQYDEEHETAYVALLKLYLQQNCSIKAVSELTYTHRNTINYRVRKIKEILKSKLDSNEERFRLMLAFYIRDAL